MIYERLLNKACGLFCPKVPVKPVEKPNTYTKPGIKKQRSESVSFFEEAVAPFDTEEDVDHHPDQKGRQCPNDLFQEKNDFRFHCRMLIMNLQFR